MLFKNTIINCIIHTQILQFSFMPHLLYSLLQFTTIQQSFSYLFFNDITFFLSFNLGYEVFYFLNVIRLKVM